MAVPPNAYKAGNTKPKITSVKNVCEIDPRPGSDSGKRRSADRPDLQPALEPTALGSAAAGPQTGDDDVQHQLPSLHNSFTVRS